MSSAPDPSKISRRQFIGEASCAGISATSLFSTLLTLRLANSLAAQSAPATTDYKALVCLFLAGGNDSFNMLVPTMAVEHAAYANVRRNLALPQDSLLQITPSNLGGRTLGIHPSMTEVRDLFTQGRLGFVSNVGSLIRPTTLADQQIKQISLFEAKGVQVEKRYRLLGATPYFRGGGLPAPGPGRAPFSLGMTLNTSRRGRGAGIGQNR